MEHFFLPNEPNFTIGFFIENCLNFEALLECRKEKLPIIIQKFFKSADHEYNYPFFWARNQIPAKITVCNAMPNF